ncbi:hypothetical protein [Archaeoglobus veneficus]|uniref:Uncharacterized protein n=1 Tax=Archaeoglobus veneficus (strain DSM 11195 / SNP6) TaxID=693661 RepID=F2KQ82_ARCVS|nr:hypothetical protein [Archaeoglobus veneficus]AEA46515.1 hypothetical protein Arcve_0485 [Archaeoglobus veneficus SNP6]
MVRTITIRVPDWIDEEKLRRAIAQAVAQVTSSKEIPVKEIREMLGIRSEDLTEELEIENNIEKLREKEKERLKW